MKKYVLLLLFCGQAWATDLIHKTGFEHHYLIAGHATGVAAATLTLNLISVSGSDEIIIDRNGQFAFDLLVRAGHAWRVEIKTLPDDPQQQSCLLSNQSGSALPVGGVDDVSIECQNQVWNWDVMSWDSGGWN